MLESDDWKMDQLNRDRHHQQQQQPTQALAIHI